MKSCLYRLRNGLVTVVDRSVYRTAGMRVVAVPCGKRIPGHGLGEMTCLLWAVQGSSPENPLTWKGGCLGSGFDVVGKVTEVRWE